MNKIIMLSLALFIITNCSDNKNTNQSNHIIHPLTDITGTWREDSSEYFWSSSRGQADAAYTLYLEDGRYLNFGYYISDNCYTLYYGDYKDLGDGNISLDNGPPHQFNIHDNTLTESNQKMFYTSTRSDLIESEFTPPCIN